ncbi:MAG: hypothetical protein ACYTEQ_23470, partial [Planctomycetota bacterium]
MQFRRASRAVTYSTFLIVVGALMAQSAGAEAGASPGESEGAGAARFAGSFAEVEVALGGGISLADISSLPRAPGGELEVLDGGTSVRVQLPAESVEALIEQGAEITVLREFILLEGGATEGSTLKSGASPLATCSGANYRGESPLEVPIPADGSWVGSAMLIGGAPPGETVTCIDVGYIIESSWVGYVYAELADQEDVITYLLVNGENGYIAGTKQGITVFNGRPVNQWWILWAREYYSIGGGYI